MNEERVILCAFSEEIVRNTDNVDIISLFADAQHLERRIATGANLSDERKRYNLICNRFEQATASLLATANEFEQTFKTEELGPEYLEILAQILEQDPDSYTNLRLGANFFTHEQLTWHISGFEKLAEAFDFGDQEDVRKRIDFFLKANKARLNVIEIQNAFILGNTLTEEEVKPTQVARPDVDLELPTLSDTITQTDRKLSPNEIFRKQIEKAIWATINGESVAVNFSNIKHKVIAEVLHEFVYEEWEGVTGPLYINIVYMDGSEARPFPLLCLRKKSEERLSQLRQIPELKVGMITARHPEMDNQVDIYWFRNQDASETRPSAESDEICYQWSVNIFREMRAEGPFRIGFYQTGFEPAVVAFYRALAEELMARTSIKPSLEVTPYYFQKGAYRKGAPWN